MTPSARVLISQYLVEGFESCVLVRFTAALFTEHHFISFMASQDYNEGSSQTLVRIP